MTKGIGRIKIFVIRIPDLDLDFISGLLSIYHLHSKEPNQFTISNDWYDTRTINNVNSPYWMSELAAVK